MATWGQFEAAAPAMATAGRRLMYRRPVGEVFLVTIRGDTLPRIHPIYVAIVEARLYAFLLPSPKATDLLEDGRFAMHTHQDPAAPSEFALRGRARPIDDEATRIRIGEAWYFDVNDENHRLFEFDIDHAILGDRQSANDWPPQYTSWRARG